MIRRLPPLYKKALDEESVKIEAREKLSLLWVISAAMAGEGKSKHFEINLVNRAYPDPEDDEIHKGLLEAISRKY